MQTWWSTEQQRTLHTGDVVPLPLMVETNWESEGWAVEVILVTDVQSDGYSSYPVWSHREPYVDGRQDRAAADAVTDRALGQFAARLRDVLTPPPTGLR